MGTMTTPLVTQSSKLLLPATERRRIGELAVTGRPWYTEVSSRILRPLQLNRTLTPEVTDTRLPEPHATTYQQFSLDGPLVDVTIPPRFLESGADGSLIATIGDLGRFLRVPLSGRLLRPGQLRAMMTTVATGEPGRAYGLGLDRKALPCGGGYWGHGGNGFGYSEVNAVSADGRRSTVVATSSRDLDETRQLDATARLLARRCARPTADAPDPLRHPDAHEVRRRLADGA